MLKQMLTDDRNEAVREAVTKSMALVVAFIENVDKYEQVGHGQFTPSPTLLNPQTSETLEPRLESQNLTDTDVKPGASCDMKTLCLDPAHVT